ncbi:MAG: threonine synthase [Muribaculaceae bacterium]|nr:threonine synthase [Muribaculaceae bacterium]
MQFYSTNRQCREASLKDAVMDGLAPDGGLFMPERIPVIPGAFFNNIADMSIRDIAYVVADLMLGDDIDSADIKRIVNETFTFDVPLVRISEGVYSLELFHGPTLAFKDVGVRFLARVISHFSSPGKGGVKVLVATSGDSGGAVARGFGGVAGVDVYILYPQGVLTPLQRAQLSLPDSNIHPIEVLGTFDDCQRMAREVILDHDIRRVAALTSANSINICRLLPQMFYFFHAYAQLIHREWPGDGVVISIPSGNLGNLTAGLLAWRMGLPVKRFVVSNNSNSVTADYLKDGVFRPRKAVRTVACAMDVGNPSNIQRIMDMFDGDTGVLSHLVDGYSIPDREILDTMSQTHSANGYLLDPHGATALAALKRSLKDGEKGIFLETAHPSKFPAPVAEATGVTFNPSAIAGHRPSHRRISPSADAMKKILISDLKQ